MVLHESRLYPCTAAQRPRHQRRAASSRAI